MGSSASLVIFIMGLILSLGGRSTGKVYVFLLAGTRVLSPTFVHVAHARGSTRGTTHEALPGELTFPSGQLLHASFWPV